MTPLRNRPVVDGTVYLSDGDPQALASGGVTAANITVAHVHQGAEHAFDEIALWLQRLAQPASGWRLVRRVADVYAAQAAGEVGLIMGWQNSLPFGQRLERVHAFHALGLRVVQLTYNEANGVGDGCMEPRGAGLTRFGASLVQALNTVGIAIDVSHCSEQTAQDAAKISCAPVLLTHANLRAVDTRARNKTDETLRAVADGGGVIGISIHGFMNWDGTPEHPPSLENFVRHVRHAVRVAGIEHVGIGTDFAAVRDEAVAQSILDMSRALYPESGGAYASAFGNTASARYPAATPTPRQFPLIIEALERACFTPAEVDAIVGRNFLRAFGEAWK